MTTFSKLARARFVNIAKTGLINAILAFLFTDLILKLVFNSQGETLLGSALSGQASLAQLPIPLAGVTIVIFASWGWLSKISFPNLMQECQENPKLLVKLETNYQQNLWRKVKIPVAKLLDRAGLSQIFRNHGRCNKSITKFLDTDLQKFYDEIR